MWKDQGKFGFSCHDPFNVSFFEVKIAPSTRISQNIPLQYGLIYSQIILRYVTTCIVLLGLASETFESETAWLL